MQPISDGQLNESEAKYLALFEGASDGVMLVDLETATIVDCNSAAHTKLGYSRKEFLRLTIQDIAPHTTPESSEKIFARIKATGYEHFQSAHRTKQGEIRNLKVTGNIIQFKGKLFGQYILYEITGSTPRETETLKTELYRYEQIVAHASDLLAFVTPDYIVQAVNPALLEMIAKPRESIIGKPLSETFSAELFNSEIKPNLDKCFKGNNISTEFELRRTDMPVLNIEFKINPSVDPQGTITGAVISGRDITKLKEAEQDQILRANVLETVAKASSLPDIMTEIALLAERHRPGMMCSIHLVDLDKNVLVAGAVPSFPDCCIEALTTVPIGEGIVCCGEAAHLKKRVIVTDIKRHPNWAPYLELANLAGLASCWSEPITDSNNEILGTLAFYYHEIREPNADDLEIMSSLADITSIAIERMKAIDTQSRLQNQLRQSQKMEAIGQLTGGIAHDFNNILGSILGFTGLALNRCIDDNNPKLKSYLTEIKQAGERARDLISQMLTFSRTGLGEPKPVNVEPLIHESLRLLRPLLPSSIELNTDIDCENLLIHSDSVQLQQVVINLCINARDAMNGKGNINLNVRQTVTHNNHCVSCHSAFQGEFIELRVKDNGSGISSHIIDRMFEPFFTTKDIGKGSGMGLPMVHGIVHQYHGHLTVDSLPEKGTTVSVYLPIYTGQNEESLPPEDFDTNTLSDSTGGHILLIDDEIQLVTILTETLENINYKVTATTSSHAALEMFLKDPHAFDLVITDQTMPHMTGLELAQAMLILRHDLPIFLCTGFSPEIDASKANKAGITRFFQKPVDIKSLIQSVDHAMRSKNRKLTTQQS